MFLLNTLEIFVLKKLYTFQHKKWDYFIFVKHTQNIHLFYFHDYEQQQCKH